MNNTYDKAFSFLVEDMDQSKLYPNSAPLAAHYTSLEVFESILNNGELWFSNPLLMNDIDEVRFSLLEGRQEFLNNRDLKKSFKEPDQLDRFVKSFEYFFFRYETEYLLDTYILCLSEHNSEDTDGLLSMWRGYGSNGRGVSIVLDLKKILPVEESPFIISQVEYPSSAERREWYNNTAHRLSKFINSNEISTNSIDAIAIALLDRLKIFALFTKHSGFSEEKEWRVVYMKDRDFNNKAHPLFSYFNGPRGIEPKLKLPVKPIDGVVPHDFSLENIVHSIIIGPSHSSKLALRSIKRMIDKSCHNDLSTKLVSSSIPYRPL